MAGVIACGLHLQAQKPQVDALRAGFDDPPKAAKLRCYWWWLNGNTTDETITRDLEAMKSHGYAGAILVDADGSGQEGNLEVPVGPAIGSPKWIALFVHALAEAQRLGLEISLNVTSRLDVGIIGGPTVAPPDAMKLLTYSRSLVEGGGSRTLQLAQPPVRNGFYLPIATLAYPLRHGAPLAGAPESGRESIRSLNFKTASIETGFSMPPSDKILHNASSTPGEQDADMSEVVDLSSSVKDGTLTWTFPVGEWEVLRVGYTDSPTPPTMSDTAGKPLGLPLDAMSARAFDDYWKQAVQPLLDAAKPYVGKSLRNVVTDSWEAGGANWTEGFRGEFKRRRGYDPLPYLPIVAGRILGCRDTSEKFLFDLRRTVADLIAENYYDQFAKYARERGLGSHPEAGGPHGAPIDGLENFRSTSYPQTEFWAATGAHRVRDDERFFVKEASSAAHIYGKTFVAAEGLTSMNPAAWSESPGRNLQPTFDRALTEGLNRLFWHEFTSSPAEYGLPGQEYFAGTHLNPNVTWWGHAGPLLLAFNRAQFLLQQGQPVSDLLYFYGDQVPGFVRVKNDDPAHVLPGYDYDVTDEDALLHRMQFEGTDLYTPEGVHYRALALPASRKLSYAALEWVSHFVQQGGVVIGLKPTGPLGRMTPEQTAEYERLANAMWAGCADKGTESRYGKGRIDCTAEARNALATMSVTPDFSYQLDDKEPRTDDGGTFDYVHRRTDDADIYFVRNALSETVKATLKFRVSGRTPELWRPDDGSTIPALVYNDTRDGHTEIPLTFAPTGSLFVIFERSGALHLTGMWQDGNEIYPSARPGVGVFSSGNGGFITTEAGSYRTTDSSGQTRTLVVGADSSEAAAMGSWSLSFPAGWGAPSSIPVEHFGSWTESQDPGVRYFSGTATYHSTLHVSDVAILAKRQMWLNLGDVREIASVRINGVPVQTLWRAPFVARIDRQLHAGDNAVEVEVTNLWPNRIIGDLQPSATKTYTKTNVRAYAKDSPLLPSGLLEPVTVQIGSVQRIR